MVTQQDIVGGSGNIQSRGEGVSYSIDELLHAMIAQSDNVAANLVIGRLAWMRLTKRVRHWG